MTSKNGDLKSKLTICVKPWKTITEDVQRPMDRSSAIINGDFGKEELVVAVTLNQGDIDALFD